MPLRDSGSALAGLLFISIALAGLWIGWDYPLGTATRMSSGYLPRALFVLLLALGLLVFVRSFLLSGPRLGRIRLRPVIVIPLAILAFAATIGTLGLVVASLLVTAIGGVASTATRWSEIALSSIVLAMAVVGIFIWGIGLLIPVWPQW